MYCPPIGGTIPKWEHASDVSITITLKRKKFISNDLLSSDKDYKPNNEFYFLKDDLISIGYFEKTKMGNFYLTSEKYDSLMIMYPSIEEEFSSVTFQSNKTVNYVSTSYAKLATFLYVNKILCNNINEEIVDMYLKEHPEVLL
jgi:hypothetical protein